MRRRKGVTPSWTSARPTGSSSPTTTDVRLLMRTASSQRRRRPPKAQRVELFASAAVKPEALWALVRDVRRLPEWTDADEVLTVEPPATSPPPTSPPPPPSPPSPRSPDLDVAVGTTVVTRDGPRRLSWTVTAREPRVLELGTTLEHGRLGIGVSVVREAMGARARIVLASAYQPDTRRRCASASPALPACAGASTRGRVGHCAPRSCR